MSTTKLIDRLKQFNPCHEGINWLKNRTLEKFIADCPRGDWMLWAHIRLYPGQLQSRTLAKGHCANTVRHLMKDERSKSAVDQAIKFGEGLITLAELNADAAAAYLKAKEKNQKETADICRQYLIWE
jgi:hypothetical protein